MTNSILDSGLSWSDVDDKSTRDYRTHTRGILFGRGN